MDTAEDADGCAAEEERKVSVSDASGRLRFLSPLTVSAGGERTDKGGRSEGTGEDRAPIESGRDGRGWEGEGDGCAGSSAASSSES